MNWLYWCPVRTDTGYTGAKVQQGLVILVPGLELGIVVPN